MRSERLQLSVTIQLQASPIECVVGMSRSARG
nr:MAG TPA: hypothetical protein [Caudoviricetes sp.]